MKKILVLFFLLIPISVSLGQPIERESGVSFSNVAPGELENKLIRTMPLKITFTSKSGVAYGGVYVRIFDASGIAVFKHLCEKPWLFLKLPEGDYNVVAVDRKKVARAAAFKIGSEGSGQKVVKLIWPKEVVGY